MLHLPYADAEPVIHKKGPREVSKQNWVPLPLGLGVTAGRGAPLSLSPLLLPKGKDFFFATVSYSPGWPRACYVAEAGPGPPTSTSRVLGSRACTAAPGFPRATANIPQGTFPLFPLLICSK